MSTPVVAIAGATGDLGGRIGTALLARGARVRAVLREGTSADDVARLEARGISPAFADHTDVGAVATALAGTHVVVSALSGLRDVIVDRQTVLLDAAVEAGVRRFIPSDFAIDFTRTDPDRNRNLDLRREFMGRVDRTSIAATSILTGAFAELLRPGATLIQPSIRSVVYWGHSDRRLDFTTRDDTAAFTAAAALDPTAPRVLRAAGDSVSPSVLAQLMTELTGSRYRLLPAGTVGSLDPLIHTARFVRPQPDTLYPAWQQMQYIRDMFSGRAVLAPLDNDRYPDIKWTSMREALSSDPTSIV